MKKFVDFENDNHMEIYCDVLLLSMLVESSIGECELLRDLNISLETGDEDRMADCLVRYASLPEEVKTVIQQGDTSLENLDLEAEYPAKKVADSKAAGKKTA